MADNELNVTEVPKDKKKRKSNLKKSDPSPNESAAPAEVVPPTPLTPHDDGAPHRSESIKQETEERRESNPQPQTPKRRPSEMSRRGSRRAATVLQDLDEGKLLELKEAFKLFDLDQDGFINSLDLKQTFGTLGKTDVTDEQIKDMLSEASNPLDFEAFVLLLGFITISLDPEEILLDALGKWDKNKSGFIDEDIIKHDLMTWGDKFTPAEVEIALEDAPTLVNNGQHMIDYVKFCKLLCGLRKKTKDITVEDFMT